MKRQKTIILLIAIWGFIYLNCSDSKIVQPPPEPLHGWIVQAPKLGINKFFAVEFVDENNGWIAGSVGKILHTTDKGKTWEYQQSNTSDLIYNAFFLNDRYGWFCTLSGTIYTTSDGGDNWNLQYSEEDLILYEVNFVDEKHGWACGRSLDDSLGWWVGVLLNTKDGGDSWHDLIRTEETSTGIVTGTINGVFFSDSLKGWITGQHIQGTLYTEDGGNSWESREPLGGAISDILFFNDLIGISYAKVGSILKTANGGFGWEFKHSMNGRWLYGMDFVNVQNGWLCGDNGFVTHTSDGGESWVNQFTNVGNTLNDIDFTSPTNGWAVGFGGTVLHTTDGGDNWEYKNGTQALLYDIKMYDKAYGFAVGQRGMLMRTENGGRDWEIVTTGTMENLNAVETPAYNCWFASGGAGLLLKSSNQGHSWTEVPLDIETNLHHIFFVDEQQGWIASSKNLLRTTDSGNSWTKDSLDFLENESIHRIYFLNADTGWFISNHGRLFKTSNAGLSWSLQFTVPSYPEYLAFTDLYFITEDHGFMTGASINFFETKDGGESWEPIYMGSDGLYYYKDIHFADSLNGWVVGEDYLQLSGIIYKTTDGGQTWELVTKSVENSLHAVDFVDNKNGWICGDNGTILHTNNGGLDY